MSRVIAYFIGGSHDLEKRWVDKKLHHIEMAAIDSDPPVVEWNIMTPVPSKAVYSIERYYRIARLRGRQEGYVYEYRPDE